MATLNPLPPLLILLVSALAWAAEAQTSGPTTWAKRVETGKEVVTTLQFYFHDIVSGPNQSAIRIAQPLNNNITWPTFFGALVMLDDPLTVGPNLSSKTVGRARGMYGLAGQADTGLIMVLSFVFGDGEYEGSSFSLLSINPALQPVREMAIVGGTGLFRMARGYVIARTYLFDIKTGATIVLGIMPQLLRMCS